MPEVDNQTVVNHPQALPKKHFNLWMLIAVVLFIVLIAGIAYELGKGQLVLPKNLMPQANTTVPTVSPVVNNQQPGTVVTVVPAPTSRTISAGIKNQLFSPYAITVPSDWLDNHTSNTASDTLTLTKGLYVLTISQAAGSAGSCVFPGDPAQAMSQVFTSGVGITGTFAQFKRGTSDNKTYTICEQKESGFSFPTSVGYITYTAPLAVDQATLGQMDQMVATLSK